MIQGQYTSLHALLITRQPGLAAHIKEELGRMGFITTQVGTYAEIATYLSSYRPSLIIANLKTADISIWDVLNKARRWQLMTGPGPAIITTAYAEDAEGYHPDQFTQMVMNVMTLHSAACARV